MLKREQVKLIERQNVMKKKQKARGAEANWRQTNHGGRGKGTKMDKDERENRKEGKRDVMR